MDYYGYYPQQSNPQFNQSYNYGGYPFGYPPQTVGYVQQPNYLDYNSQYSPFGVGVPNYMQQPTPQQPMNPPTYGGYVPGMHGPIQAQTSDGRIDFIQPNPPVPSQQSGYIPGGVSSQGGYNPVYQPQQQNPSSVYNSYRGGYQKLPVGRFDPNDHNQYILPGSYVNQFGYQTFWMNEFDNYAREYMYNFDTSSLIYDDFLENIILDEKQKQQAEQQREAMRWASQGNYYGYAGYYASQMKQKELDTFKKQQEQVLCMIGKCVHSYFGDKDFNESEYLDKFNPVKLAQKQQQEAPRIHYNPDIPPYVIQEQMSRVQSVKALHNDIPRIEAINQQINNIKAQYYGMIKASHDKALGVTPGESYGLSTYLDNGGALVADVYKQEMRKRRSRYLKYDRKEFYRGLAAKTGDIIRYRPDENDLFAHESGRSVLARLDSDNSISQGVKDLVHKTLDPIAVAVDFIRDANGNVHEVKPIQSKEAIEEERRLNAVMDYINREEKRHEFLTTVKGIGI